MGSSGVLFHHMGDRLLRSVEKCPLLRTRFTLHRNRAFRIDALVSRARRQLERSE